MSEKVTCIVKGEAHLHSDCRSITKIKTDYWKEYTREQAHEQVKAHPGSIVVEGGGQTAPLFQPNAKGSGMFAPGLTTRPLTIYCRSKRVDRDPKAGRPPGTKAAFSTKRKFTHLASNRLRNDLDCGGLDTK